MLDLFWAILERFDPDVFVAYTPTFEEVADSDPAWHGDFLGRERRKREREHGSDFADQAIGRIKKIPVYNARVEPESLDALLRLAPFQSHEGGSLDVHTLSTPKCSKLYLWDK